MRPSPHVLRGCPVCGRPLRIQTAHLGRELSCQHCRGRFCPHAAYPPQDGSAGPGSTLLRRAEQLLQQAGSQVGDRRAAIRTAGWPAPAAA